MGFAFQRVRSAAEIVARARKGKQAQIDAFVKANPDQIAKYKATIKQ